MSLTSQLPPSFERIFHRAGEAASRTWRYFRDGWLAAALLLGLLLGAQGFTWGTYDCLNLDRMALKNMLSKDHPPLHPGRFFKPPFYTYMNHFLARVPAQTFASNLFWMPGDQRFDLYLKLRLALARFWNLMLFAGSVLLVYAVAREYFGLTSARMAALILATSAGFVPYQVFLTTDLAVIFMMLAAFACAAVVARTPTMGWSVAAGLLAGLATATKYNGLFVAVALPAAHLLASRGNPVMASLRRPAAWICGLMVPVGFVLGSPYVAWDFRSFASDFVYNYRVTPVYGGESGDNGYGKYFQAYFEIFGWPGLAFLVAGILVGLVAVWRARRVSDAWKLSVLAGLCVIFYAWRIGMFPRMETRFVLPSAPFVLLLAAAGFGAMMRLRWVTGPALGAILIFNLLCGWWMGELFRRDPRNGLLEFASETIAPGTKIEVSPSIPRLNDLSGKKYRLLRMPSGVDRYARFAEQFSEDDDVMNVVSLRQEGGGVEWFAPEARRKRNPEWIFWSSIDLEHGTWPFYEDLMCETAESSGYWIVRDEESPRLPSWVYPQHTEFLQNRATVWKKYPPAP